jgi:hypothetical protein
MKIKYGMIGMLILLLCSPVFAQTGPGSVLVLKDIFTPSDVYPGDSFNISFKVENGWYAEAKEIYVYLEGGYPLLNISPTESYYIKKLGYESPSKTSVPLTFDLSVDKSASAGSYTINVVLNLRRYADTIGVSGGYKRYREVIPVLIEVKGTPEIEVFVKSSTPGEIKSGEEVEIQLEVVNIGSDEARNILISPESIPEIEVLWFSGTVYVGDVAPQKSKTAAISIDVAEEADAKDYALPIKVIYETPEGETISEEGEIKIPIEESVDFAVIPVANSANSGDREKMITFDVQNTGDKVAEEVKAMLRASYPFTPTGNEYFIGELKPGESTEVSFHVDLDSGASTQKYPIDIIIQWEDDDKEYSKTDSSFVDVSRIESDPRVYYWITGGIVALIILARIKRKIKKK